MNVKEVYNKNIRYKSLKIEEILDYVIKEKLLTHETIKTFITERNNTTLNKLKKDYKAFEFLVVNAYFQKPNHTRLFINLLLKRKITFEEVLKNGANSLYAKWLESLTPVTLNYDGDWQKRHMKSLIKEENAAAIAYKTFYNENEKLFDDLRESHSGKGNLYIVKDDLDFIHITNSWDEKPVINTIIEQDFQSHMDFYYLKKRLTFI